MRLNTLSAGRSINLALSDRGLRGLEAAGIVDDILSVAIPMHGRMMHSIDGAQQYQPYGKEGQAINSVSRGGINKALLECADNFENVNITFNVRCTHVDLESATAHFMHQDGTTSIIESDCIIATDGAYSAVREVLQKTDRFNYQQFYIDHGYKELHIPADMTGEFKMEKHALHIWPRKQYMMIALPNMDGSFTCTLFFPFEGNPSFSSLQTDEQIISFFTEQFPDAMEMMPSLLEDYRNNPVSSLVTVKAFPWAYKNKVLLMGDAAHAIVPFFGQGMNAGFEDCRVLNDLIEKNEDFAHVFPEFTRIRKPCGDAILELALRNYIEMRDKTADEKFLHQKKIESWFSARHPDKWIPLYSQVSFSHIPYHEALANGNRQQQIMDKVMELPEIYSEWQTEKVEDFILRMISQ